MSLKVISHLIIWPLLLVVGGVLLLTPKDMLRQPILPAAESPRAEVAEIAEIETPAVEPALEVMPATLTVTYAASGPVNGPSEDIAAIAIENPDGARPITPSLETAVDRRWITAAGLNVRTGPSIEADHIASLPFGTEVEVLETSGKWAHIEAGSVSGWLSANFLSTEKPTD